MEVRVVYSSCPLQTKFWNVFVRRRRAYCKGKRMSLQGTVCKSSHGWYAWAHGAEDATACLSWISLSWQTNFPSSEQGGTGTVLGRFRWQAMLLLLLTPLLRHTHVSSLVRCAGHATSCLHEAWIRGRLRPSIALEPCFADIYSYLRLIIFFFNF